MQVEGFLQLHSQKVCSRQGRAGQAKHTSVVTFCLERNIFTQRTSGNGRVQEACWEGAGTSCPFS